MFFKHFLSILGHACNIVQFPDDAISVSFLESECIPDLPVPDLDLDPDLDLFRAHPFSCEVEFGRWCVCHNAVGEFGMHFVF